MKNTIYYGDSLGNNSEIIGDFGHDLQSLNRNNRLGEQIDSPLFIRKISVYRNPNRKPFSTIMDGTIAESAESQWNNDICFELDLRLKRDTPWRQFYYYIEIKYLKKIGNKILGGMTVPTFKEIGSYQPLLNYFSGDRVLVNGFAPGESFIPYSLTDCDANEDRNGLNYNPANYKKTVISHHDGTSWMCDYLSKDTCPESADFPWIGRNVEILQVASYDEQTSKYIDDRYFQITIRVKKNKNDISPTHELNTIYKVPIQMDWTCNQSTEKHIEGYRFESYTPMRWLFGGTVDIGEHQSGNLIYTTHSSKYNTKKNNYFFIGDATYMPRNTEIMCFGWRCAKDGEFLFDSFPVDKTITTNEDIQYPFITHYKTLQAPGRSASTTDKGVVDNALYTNDVDYWGYYDGYGCIDKLKNWGDFFQTQISIPYCPNYPFVRFKIQALDENGNGVYEFDPTFARGYITDGKDYEDKRYGKIWDENDSRSPKISDILNYDYLVPEDKNALRTYSSFKFKSTGDRPWARIMRFSGVRDKIVSPNQHCWKENNGLGYTAGELLPVEINKMYRDGDTGTIRSASYIDFSKVDKEYWPTVVSFDGKENVVDRIYLSIGLRSNSPRKFYKNLFINGNIRDDNKGSEIVYIRVKQNDGKIIEAGQDPRKSTDDYSYPTDATIAKLIYEFMAKYYIKPQSGSFRLATNEENIRYENLKNQDLNLNTSPLYITTDTSLANISQIYSSRDAQNSYGKPVYFHINSLSVGGQTLSDGYTEIPDGSRYIYIDLIYIPKAYFYYSSTRYHAPIYLYDKDKKFIKSIKYEDVLSNRNIPASTIKALSDYGICTELIDYQIPDNAKYAIFSLPISYRSKAVGFELGGYQIKDLYGYNGHIPNGDFFGDIMGSYKSYFAHQNTKITWKNKDKQEINTIDYQRRPFSPVTASTFDDYDRKILTKKKYLSTSERYYIDKNSGKKCLSNYDIKQITLNLSVWGKDYLDYDKGINPEVYKYIYKDLKLIAEFYSPSTRDTVTIEMPIKSTGMNPKAEGYELLNMEYSKYELIQQEGKDYKMEEYEQSKGIGYKYTFKFKNKSTGIISTITKYQTSNYNSNNSPIVTQRDVRGIYYLAIKWIDVVNLTTSMLNKNGFYAYKEI